MDANTHIINEHLAWVEAQLPADPCRKCDGPVSIEEPDEDNPRGGAYCDDCGARQ